MNMKFGRTWLMLALALVMILSVTGGTIAWFTDNVESKDNIIKSGTLDIEMSVYDLEENKWVNVESEEFAGSIFNYDLWEPGYTDYKYVKIANVGSLAFKYDLDIVPNGTAGILAEVIDVYFADDSVEAKKLTRAEFGTLFGDPVDTLDMVIGDQVAAEGVLLPKNETTGETGEIVLAIGLKMQESADNAYQNQSIGTDFDVQLRATQATVETDAFDDQYDAEADYLMLPKAEMEELTELGIQTMGASFGGLEFLVGDYTLACGVELSALETLDDLTTKNYGDWVVDFELSTTKEIAAADDTGLALAGFYPNFNEEYWLAFKVQGMDVPAYSVNRLMTPAGMKMKYYEIVDWVKEFKCGVIANEDYFAGETITMRLCMYETDGHGNETGPRHVLDTYSYTFPTK